MFLVIKGHLEGDNCVQNVCTCDNGDGAVGFSLYGTHICTAGGCQTGHNAGNRCDRNICDCHMEHPIFGLIALASSFKCEETSCETG